MLKNIIILFLIYLLCSLLFQNKKNVDILVEDLATTKEKVIDGADYVKETFEEKFSKEEPMIKFEGSKSNHIKEDTFLNDLKQQIQEETFLNEK